MEVIHKTEPLREVKNRTGEAGLLRILKFMFAMQ